MKIIAYSDAHGLVPFSALDPGIADICVIAGDIAPLRGFSQWEKTHQADWMRNEFARYCRRHPNTDFVLIPGNHDFWGLMPKNAASWMPKNAHLLVNAGCEVRGLKFYGLPNVPVINRKWAFESTPDMMEERCAAIPAGTDVLIAHSPPLVDGSDIDTSDLGGTRWRRSPHFGSPEITAAVRRVQPRFLFCGHIHTGDHSETAIGKTKCYNVSLLDEAYRQSYVPLEIEV